MLEAPLNDEVHHHIIDDHNFYKNFFLIRIGNGILVHKI